MRRSILAAAIGLAGLFFTTAASAQTPDPPVKVGRMLFSRLAQQLPLDVPYLKIEEFTIIGCRPTKALKPDGSLRRVSLREYGPIFAQQMSEAGRGDVTKTDLFTTQSTDGADYEVGALVNGMDIEVCVVNIANMAAGRPSSTPDHFKGAGSLSVEWQIYSRSQRKVIKTISTMGKTQVKSFARWVSADETTRLFINDAFADAAKALAKNPDFIALLDAPVVKDTVQSTPGQQARINVDGGHPTPRPVSDETGSVVLISSPEGDGSGVLISTDGYILTDAHVVGSNKVVKIRWSDGIETEGQVVRLHTKRDVALIKTDPRGRTPLPIRTTSVQQGDTVWAIGAPVDSRYQGTVTRGVVSANRIIDGLALIQSDIAVNHGNSGGPLLDDEGYVIGLTESGYQPALNVQVGINFFTPIRDALDFLSIDLVAFGPPMANPPPVQKASTPAAKSTLSR